MPYSAKLCLTSSLPTICTISHYLHYFQLFTTTTLPNYSQLFALFPTIQFTSISNRQTVVGMPVFQQTLAVRPMIGIAWLPCYFLAELGWPAIDWQSLVAMPYSARLCLTSSLPTICTISNYLHYFQLFTTTLPNYSQRFALFPTI